MEILCEVVLVSQRNFYCYCCSKTKLVQVIRDDICAAAEYVRETDRVFLKPRFPLPLPSNGNKL